MYEIDDILDTIPLRENGRVSFRHSTTKSFCGFPDAIENGQKVFPSFNIPVSICTESKSDTGSILVIGRQIDKVSRRKLDIDDSIEEIGPVYLQVKRKTLT
ncbi:MAG: hypothetical protein AB8W37_12735 [Arsenophonus endosymbiont of Dermacentor nuttalli]